MVQVMYRTRGKTKIYPWKLSCFAILVSLGVWLTFYDTFPLLKLEAALNADANQDQDSDAIAVQEKYPIVRLSEGTITTPYRYKELDEDKRDCLLTVVLTDPRIPFFPANDTLFTKTLESVAEFIPSTACILLQTSVCLLEQCIQNGVSPDALLYYDDETLSQAEKPPTTGFSAQVLQSCPKPKPKPPSERTSQKESLSFIDENSTTAHAIAIAKALIRQRSGPLLHAFWNRGRVRVAILNHTSYSLRSCHEFYSINSAWLSAKYWTDEFIPRQDSDKVLIVQRDVFLCKPLHWDTWKEFAYVGSPWFDTWPWMKKAYPTPTNNGSISFQHQSDNEYAVDAWRTYWNQLDQLYTGHRNDHADHHEKADSCRTMEAQVNNIQCPLPPHHGLSFPSTFPEKPRPWVGNGGLSLRSRKWMVRMIRLCPKKGRVSHLLPELVEKSMCRVIALQEDMFFSLMLTLTGAKIATPHEASLFGIDQDFGWPYMEDTSTTSEQVKSWLGNDAWATLQKERKDMGHYLPVGQHKCFLSFRKNGYGCVEQRHCKYSFNANNRIPSMMV